MIAPVQQNVRAALLLALGGFAILSVGDALVKTMAGQWPGTAVAMLRYTSAALGLALLVLIVEGRKAWRIPKPWLQLGRGAGVSVATICFFLGVMAIPLADATAIQFTSPIITAMLAPFFLKERTTRAVWLAMALAFAGVLVVLRPNVLALGAAALYPVGAAAGMACLMICNRKAAGLASPLAMQAYAAVMAAPLITLAALLLAATGPAQFQFGAPPAGVVVKMPRRRLYGDDRAHAHLHGRGPRLGGRGRADDLCAAAGRGGSGLADLRHRAGSFDLCRRGPDHRRRPAALAFAEAEGGAGAGMIMVHTATGRL